MNSDQPSAPAQDHGQIVHRARLRISWAWVFPILAAIATFWLFWSDWRSNGPEIEITFDDAPGIQSGKTPLIYRGVSSGTVTGIWLDKSLDKVVIRIRLKAFAADLASKGTDFWIDQPVVSLGETSGLESLIQGNSIAARTSAGPIVPTYQFVGLDRTPLTPLESPALILKLRASQIPFLDRGSQLFYRGVVVGLIEDKAIDESGSPYLRAVVKQEFAHLVRANARFWPVSATSVKLGPGGVKVDLMGLKTILLGAVEFDVFGPPGAEVGDEEEFVLFPDKSTASASGPPVFISFRNAVGLHPGQTEIRYLGIPVGYVESIALNIPNQSIDTIARFQPQFDSLRTQGSTFTLIRPELSLEGVSGLDTLITGVYIECVPGPGPALADHFEGRTSTDAQSTAALAETRGVRISLYSPSLPPIGQGAPIFHHGLVVGRVLDRRIDADGRPCIDAVIRSDFASSLPLNARFWHIPPATVAIGPGMLKLNVASLETLVQGALAFDTFGPAASLATTGSQFSLFPSEDAARAISPPIQITFDNGQGLLAGHTQIRYLGQPVGLVDAISTRNGKVEVTARLNEGHDFLRRAGSAYSVVRLNVSLQGVTGLETVISGVYIECVPSSSGPLENRFTGVSFDKASLKAAEQHGFEIVLSTGRTNIDVDAPVTYRGLTVGRIARKTLSDDGRSVSLVAVIKSEYAPLIRENTKFWDNGGLRISLAFISFKVQTSTLDALTHSGVALATPDNAQMGPRVRQGHVFDLASSPRREWLRWAPSIPGEDR